MIQRKHKTTTYDFIRTIFFCLSNGLNIKKNQIYNAFEISKITGLDRGAISRHLSELVDLQIIDFFYVKNTKYYTLDKHIQKKIKIAGIKYFEKIMTEEINEIDKK